VLVVAAVPFTLTYFPALAFEESNVPEFGVPSVIVGADLMGVYKDKTQNLAVEGEPAWFGNITKTVDPAVPSV